MPNDHRHKPIMIIGAGDVVKGRLLPALERADRLGSVEIASTEIDDRFREKVAQAGISARVQTQGEILRNLLRSDAYPIIATPPDSHMTYMRVITKRGLRYAVEKPIASNQDDISALLAAKDSTRDYGFALSYYGLEKALPLSFLLRQNKYHAKFLDTKGLSLSDIKLLSSQLGRARSLSVRVLESVERSPTATRRAWTEDPALGGLLFETVVHPAILVQKVVGDIGALLIRQVRWGTSQYATRQDSPTFLRLFGQARGVEVDMAVGKYMPPSLVERHAIIEFERGVASCSFDSMTCCVATGESEVVLGVKPSYASRYAVQTALVLDYFDHGWRDVRTDDWDDQLVVLNWLCRIKTPTVAASYDLSGNSSLFREMLRLS